MRVRRGLGIIAALAAIGALLWASIFHLYNFLCIFSVPEPHRGQGLRQSEIVDLHKNHPERPAVVPKIIHQIFHNWKEPGNETLPADWALQRQGCLDLHKDWDIKLWTDKSSDDFLQENYPWILPTYQNFQHPVQKVDTLRYILMYHYGGIYIDLDNGCRQNLEALRAYPTWTTYGGAGALSNNILGATPRHPFWEKLVNSIQRYAWNYPLPYITISYATGQWFLSDIWRQYHLELPAGDPGLMYMWMSHFEGEPEDIFFNYGRGGTWEGWDNAWFKSIGDHLLLLIAGVASIAGIVAFLIVRRRRALSKGEYSKIESTV